jgi:hypothetical protein
MRGNGCLHYFVTAADGTKFCAKCERNKEDAPGAKAHPRPARPAAEPASLSRLPKAGSRDSVRRF